MLNPKQEKGIRDKLANNAEHIAKYNGYIADSEATIATYAPLRAEAIEVEKELRKLLFEFTNPMAVPSEVAPGKPVTISVGVKNVSSVIDNCFLTLKVNGEVLGEKEINPLGIGETRTESHKISRSIPGVYEVNVNNLLSSFTVRGA